VTVGEACLASVEVTGRDPFDLRIRFSVLKKAHE
jgi:hypothetical protein